MDVDDDICKAVSDVVRSSMKQSCDSDAEPEKLADWGLYVGGIREAADQDMLQRLGICAVVNAAPDVVHFEYPKHWRVLTVDADDDDSYPLLENHLEAVTEFVDQQRADGRPLLLHCLGGMNRSPALCAAYLMKRERQRLFSVVKVISEKRGWVLSNDGFVRQRVRYARAEGLLDPTPAPSLDVVEEEPHSQTCHQVQKARSKSFNHIAPRCHASRLGRSLSMMSTLDEEKEEKFERTGTVIDRTLSEPSSAFSDVSEDLTQRGPKTSDMPRRIISNKDCGYASRLPRQDSISSDLKKVRPLKDLREGTATLQSGMYLYVIMLGDPEYIRLIHEDDLVHEGVLAGHTSLVERNEFRRGWAKQWESSDPQVRHTVLYAGELEYEAGLGVAMWNNHSGHYTPSAEDHVKVDLDPATFVSFDE